MGIEDLERRSEEARLNDQFKELRQILDKAKSYGKFNKIVVVINKKHKTYINNLKIKKIKIITGGNTRAESAYFKKRTQGPLRAAHPHNNVCACHVGSCAEPMGAACDGWCGIHSTFTSPSGWFVIFNTVMLIEIINVI